MKIEYNILWVEDEESWYETTEQLFEETLDDLGFKLNSKRCESIDEVKVEVGKNNLSSYDILLIDFTLRGKETGDKIIEFIRNIKEEPILTDVLFYSSAVENVRASMHELGLEGVYTADRKEIESKFEQVLKTTIKKIQEVNTMRGLIMAETSDLDVLMAQIIEILLSGDVSEKIGNYVEQKIKDLLDNNKRLASNPDVVAKVKDSRIFSSLSKAKTITRLYKLKAIGIKNFAGLYDQEVISTRNLFAHVSEVDEDGQKVLVSHITGEKEIFNEERCIVIRKHLIKYRNILEDIKDRLLKESSMEEMEAEMID